MMPFHFVRKRVSAVLCLLLVGLLVIVPLGIAAPSGGARIVKYSREEIVPVRAKLRFSTLIVLPDNEEILDFTTGDREFWIINGVHNLCYIHPAQAAIRSNLNLITASGNIYSFLLTEISSEPNTEPDLKLFIQPKETSTTASLAGYVRASEAEANRKEIEQLRAQTDEQIQAARAQAKEEVSRFRSAYAARLHFDYNVDSKAAHEPFFVSAIYHDDAFTYIQSSAPEKPTLYELKDGKPNLINFQLESGVFIVPKLLDNGYLAIGNKKLTFSRRITAK